MTLLTVVKIGNAVPTLRHVPLLYSVHVYSAGVRPIYSIIVRTLLLVVRFISVSRSLPLLLLLPRVLSIVDTNSYSDILVESLRAIDLIELVLNLFLKAVVEQLYKAFVVKFDLYSVLLEDYSIGYS